MDRCVSTPGKLFLCGEYAVLWGGSALIAAVGPRLAGAMRLRSNSEVHIVSPSGRLRGLLTPIGVTWDQAISAPFLFAARGVEEAVRAAGAKTSAGFELFLGPSARSPSGEKLGLGGSAQVALVSVELARRAFRASFDTLKVALLAHYKAQTKGGSGGDVAAIHAGGLVRYRRYPLDRLESASALGQLPSALADSPPVWLERLEARNLRLSFAHTGKSSSTLEQIKAVESKLSAGQRQNVTQQSDRLAQDLERALLADDFQALGGAVEKLQRLLSTLGALETDNIRDVLAIAARHGAAGKISGAGAGDGCVLFSPDEDTERRMLAALKEAGFWACSLSLETGMQREEEPSSTLRQLIEKSGG